jgi:glycosyltransferase involved in cell wall biosynthesis
MKKLKISIVSGTYNEAENVEEWYDRVQKAISPLRDRYDFELIVIDNASEDDTVERLKVLTENDRQLKVIINNRNFGHIRSPYWGIMQATGDAVVYLASDLQDPPELIPSFIIEWERGWKVTYAVKQTSQEAYFFNLVRKTYYRILHTISDVPLIDNATGFGIYDKAIIQYLRSINDPYPYLRGLVCELGFPVKTMEFHQPSRERGFSKNNFYRLYDMAMLGIVSHSMVPLRIAGFLGIVISVFSFIFGIYYLIQKLIHWQEVPLGVAPLIIGYFFGLGLILLFLSLLGEYVASIQNYVKNRPIVTERERINFD